MGLLDQDPQGLTTRRVIVEGIVPTIKTVSESLEVYGYLPWAPNTPCALVALEVLDPSLVQTMDRRMWSEQFRIWVLTSAQDAEEACMSVYDYCDTNGDLSIPKAFDRPDAPWREVKGLAELYVDGHARMPLDIQGPGWVDWNGSVYWAHALLVKARYGV